MPAWRSRNLFSYYLRRPKLLSTYGLLQPRSNLISLHLCLILLICLTSGCGGLGEEESDLPEDLYLPPSPAVSTLSATLQLENATLPTPNLTCVNSLLFVADRTIPDGTEVRPGAILDKIWDVENNGTCNYDERYRLKLIGGSELGARTEQALYPARSGTQFQIHIRFVAPQEPGKARSAWQAFDPDGNPFGDPIYLEIVVME